MTIIKTLLMRLKNTKKWVGVSTPILVQDYILPLERSDITYCLRKEIEISKQSNVFSLFFVATKMRVKVHEKMGNSIKWKRESLEARNLIFFFILAFGWSWAFWFVFIRGWITMPEGVGTPNVDLVELIKVLPILLISPFGPTISAFLITLSSNGKEGIKQLWSRFWNKDISKIWLVILFLFYPTYFLTLRILGHLSGIPQPTPVWYSNPLLILFGFLPSLLHGGLSEEFGWRGYALPRLQARFSAFWASLILGVIEGLWHYPLIIMPQDSRFGMSLITLIIWQTLATYYRTWIFNSTNGSILAAVLFHAAGNTSELIVPVNVFRIPWLPEDPYVPSIMIIVGIIFVAGILLVSNRRDMITVLSRGEQVEKIG